MYPMGMLAQPQQISQPQGLIVCDPMAVANAAASALDAAFGGGGALPPVVPSSAMVSATQPLMAPTPTRILVLLNMVMDEDLATEEDHKMLEEEVREEVSRYGKLVSIKIPRPTVSGFLCSSVS
jgi:splicing factor U2AF subunit